jgi:hypothetical protein
LSPSNLFTVADPAHNTGLRLGFLNPDCQVFVSYCEGLVTVNELDGFNLQPQLTVRFSGPIDVATVNSNTFFLIRLGDALPGGDQSQKIVGVNQISFHTEHNVLSAESDEFLDEHTRYAVIVTREIRDSEGQRVRAAKEFKKFRKDSSDPALDAYQRSLEEALRVAKKFKIKVEAVDNRQVSERAILQQVGKYAVDFDLIGSRELLSKVGQAVPGTPMTIVGFYTQRKRKLQLESVEVVGLKE